MALAPAPHKPSSRGSRYKGEFRFSYFTPIYTETVAFYRDSLGLPLVEQWDRSESDKGSCFSAASGLIELLTVPVAGEAAEHFWDPRPPQGAFIVVEVEDVVAVYRNALDKRIPIKHPLTKQEWGHESFTLVEPNGLILYMFSHLPDDSSTEPAGADPS